MAGTRPYTEDELNQGRSFEVNMPLEANLQAQVDKAKEILLDVQAFGTKQVILAAEKIAENDPARKMVVDIGGIYAAYSFGSIITSEVLKDLTSAQDVTPVAHHIHCDERPQDKASIIQVGAGLMGAQQAKLASKRGVEMTFVDTVQTQLNGIQNLPGIQGSLDLIETIRKAKIDFPSKPVVINLMVPQNSLKDLVGVIEKLTKTETSPGSGKYLLDANDVVIESGNTKVSLAKEIYERMSKLDVGYLSAGTSGGALGSGGELRGVTGARGGACIMVENQNTKALEIAEPFLCSIAKDRTIIAVGKYVADLVKGLHNAQEYAEMEYIGDIVGYWIDELNINLEDVLKMARKLKTSKAGSYLIDCLVFGLENDMLAKEGHVQVGGKTFGEMMELVEMADNVGVNLKLTKQALKTREEADREDNPIRSTKTDVIHMLRAVFGLHQFETVK